MEWPRVEPRRERPTGRGVYADLDELIRIQYRARGFSFLPRQPIHSILAGRHASRLRGRGLDFEELRGYLPGDDVRNIDWRATARMRKPFVRVYTEERDRPGLLVVDQRMSMFFGSRAKMKSVAAAEAAALGAWRFTHQGDRVGAIVFGDEDLSFVRPHRSGRTVMRILNEIVRFNRLLAVEQDAETGDGMLNEALRRAVRVASHDHIVTIISDFDGVDEETASLMTRLAQHNDVIAVHVSDALERRLPDAGRLAFRKGERELEVDTSTRRLREAYAAHFASRADVATTFLRRRGTPVIAIDTAGDVAEQVRHQLGQAARPRR